jgi:Zn-dependent metalloprotease
MHRRLQGAAALASCICALALGAACASTKGPDALGRLQNDSGAQWFAASCENFPTPCVLQPRSAPKPWLASGQTPEDAARAFFAQYGEIYGMHDPQRELTLAFAGGPDARGARFASFSQLEGVPVLRTGLSVQFASDGRIALVSGQFAPGLASLSVAPSVTPSAALATAQADLLAKVGAVGNAQPTAAPTLAIDPIAGGSPKLVYSFVVAYADTTNSYDAVAMEYEIDALSGAVVSSEDAVAEITGGCQGAGCTPVMGAQGLGVLGDTKTFTAMATTAPAVGPFYMQQAAGSGTTTRFVGAPDGSIVYSSNDQNSWDTAPPDNGSAVDAYVYLGVADAWWQQRGRNSFDGLGRPIAIVAHDPTQPNNAAYMRDDKSFRIGISKPAGSIKPYSAALDVMGHEFMHGVVAFTLGLGSSGTSGALNESLGDVFGQFVEGDTYPNGGAPYTVDVTTLSEATGPPLRNLAHPSMSPPGTCGSGLSQPDNIASSLFTQDYGSFDEGGKHCKDGVPNNAWYLATFGGTNDSSQRQVDPSVKIGWPNSEDLYVYFVTSNVLGGSATIHDFAGAMWAAARARFGSDPTGPMAGVGCAWWAVGVLSEAELQDWNVSVTGNVCGRSSDAGQPPPPPMDSGAGDAVAACGYAGGATMISDNGAAGSMYCPLVSADEIGSAFGLSGVTGPLIVSSQSSMPFAGVSVDEASCYYYANGVLVADIGYTYAGIQGSGASQYSIAQSSLMSVGCVESPASAGQEAFLSVCPGCDGGTGGPLLTVLADSYTILLIWGQGATEAQEEGLADLILGRLP